ncbi:hypothetical protein PAXRUDRAFT_37022 [Paxillus rubicundulus Ve08.2h10]|uniref:DUF6570 domain-containing protein n=1 Tax=Paxillus rubicundulus Ve08.2h10 TaxID=930991 RepID=A0A0D0CHZ5_9AGAM|nr:hypothetical protein PAXRUDRAFT_37022 [Paxillus rubicundulus Ve08.2h10]
MHGGSFPEDASQCYNCSNVAILPQESTKLRTVLPPSVDDVRDAMCVIFTGGHATPTKETIKKFRPVLVSKSRVETLIMFLMTHNECCQMNWSDLAENLVMENIAYTSGTMKVQALAFALDNRAFLTSRTGSTYMHNGHPGLMSSMFPHLDPWGIGSFNHLVRNTHMHLSMEAQVKNLVLQDNLPFEHDPNFALICWEPM